MASVMMPMPRLTRARTAESERVSSISATATATSATGRISAPAPITQCTPWAMRRPTGPAMSNHTEAPMTADSPMSTSPHASAWLPPRVFCTVSCSPFSSSRSVFFALRRRVTGSSAASSSKKGSVESSLSSLRRRPVVSFPNTEPTPRAAAPSELPTTLYAEPTRSSVVSAASIVEVEGWVSDAA